MIEELSEQRIKLLFDLSNIITEVYNSDSYNGFTGEHGANFNYPVWFPFGKKDLPEFGFRRPDYDAVKALHEKFESPIPLNFFLMHGKCKFGANHMYVIQTAEFVLRKLETNYNLLWQNGCFHHHADEISNSLGPCRELSGASNTPQADRVLREQIEVLKHENEELRKRFAQLEAEKE